MKNNLWIALILGALTTNVALSADAPFQIESQALSLSADEQAFAAKLNDQNRRSFTGRLSAEQRKATMIAVTNGANADEAVQRMLFAREIKETQVVAAAEETEFEDSGLAEFEEESNQ